MKIRKTPEERFNASVMKAMEGLCHWCGAPVPQGLEYCVDRSTCSWNGWTRDGSAPPASLGLTEETKP